jgi:hypothetical protein
MPPAGDAPGAGGIEGQAGGRPAVILRRRQTGKIVPVFMTPLGSNAVFSVSSM